ncbi:MAG: phosphatidate cytidylyltransferase [Ferruginibacter sp.]
MKRLFYFLLPFITILLSSCEAIAGIFKAGVWTGVIIVVAIIVLIAMFVGRKNK